MRSRGRGETTAKKRVSGEVTLDQHERPRKRRSRTKGSIPLDDVGHRLSFSSGGTGHVKELNFFAADPNFSGVLV